MYFVNKYSCIGNLSIVIYFDINQTICKKFLLDYVNKFCNDNKSLSTEYFFKFNKEFSSIKLYKKDILVRKGYIWDSVEYKVSIYERFSISYYSDHYKNNILLILPKYDTTDENINRKYDIVIKELKTNPLFLKRKKIS